MSMTKQSNSELFSPTRPSGPSWSESRHVRVFVIVFVCLSPSNAIFSSPLIGPQVTWTDPGLSLALRSHDQITASYWSTLPRPWTGAILISISSRALKMRMVSGVRSQSRVEPQKRGCVPEFDLDLESSPKNEDVFRSSISILIRSRVEP